MNASVAPRPRVSTVAPVLALFFLAPLIAEYLLGDLPITLLSALIVLVPMYGGGALLVREFARATGRGWPTILLLGGAYAMIEEGFLTQSLFNPDYLHLHMGLLNAGYIPALGMGAWWTLWMLNVHPVWSITTPIVLTEALFPDRAARPWLGNVGRVIVSVILAFGLVANFWIGYRQDHFIASPMQFAIAGALFVTFLAVALTRRPASITGTRRAASGPPAPRPWIVGTCALVAASATLLIGKEWDWWAFLVLLTIDLILLVLVRRWSAQRGWSRMHVFALGAAAALAYAWHGFIQPPVVGKPGAADRAGNAIFALAGVLIVWLGAKRTRRHLATSQKQSV